MMRSRGGLGLLGAVLGTGGLTTGNTSEILSTAHEVVSDTGAVLHPSAADEHDRVLLEVVALTRDVGGDGAAVGELDTRHFTDSRVWFFGLCGEDLAADALDERFGLERGHLVDGWAVCLSCAAQVLLQRHRPRCRCGEGARGREGSGRACGQARGPSNGATEEQGDDVPRHFAGRYGMVWCG